MKRARIERGRQPTTKELTDELLGFLGRKFYEGDGVNFVKDRSRLLAWVVLWPAAWLDGKGVSITTARYREIFMTVMMAAVVHGTDKVKYRPAWLRQVIQSHFRIHGEEIYEAAKSVRSLVENALLVAGRPAQAQPNPIRELAAARAILVASKPARKPVVKEQLRLL
jgi:hypothetical protein